MSCVAQNEPSNLVLFIPTPQVIPQNQSDNLFLALASENGASLIVSGDTDLLSLEEHELIQIVTPGEACEVIQRLIA
jgi:predicted nucleic acid-binding protein